MRIKNEIAEFIKSRINTLFENTEVYLFGSRTSDGKRGGDIDILILSEKKIPNHMLRKIRVEFYKKFGWRKLDLVKFTFGESHPFKELILDEARKL